MIIAAVLDESDACLKYYVCHDLFLVTMPANDPEHRKCAKLES